MERIKEFISVKLKDNVFSQPSSMLSLMIFLTYAFELYFQFSSVQLSHSVELDSLRPHESQHARPPCPSPTPGVHLNSRPSSE